MSHAYYATRLWWAGSRGVAKLHGHLVQLLAPPALGGGMPVDGIDYTPEVAVYRICRRFEGWSDMTRDEIAQADRLLRSLCSTTQEFEP